MSEEVIDPVALIQRRADERFAADESLAGIEALWVVLLEATDDERSDFLYALLDSHEARQRTERDQRLREFTDGVIAEAIRPREQKQ